MASDSPAAEFPAADDLAAVLIARTREELAVDFSSDRAMQIGVADSVDGRGPVAAVAIQTRTDGHVQAFSFNQFDAHLPFTLRIPAADLAALGGERLARALSEPGRGWAGPLVGAVAILHRRRLIDLAADFHGVSVALLYDAGAANADATGGTIAACVAALAGLFQSSTRSDGEPASASGDPAASICNEVAANIPGFSERRRFAEDFTARTWRR